MITIFNRKELFTTFSMQVQAELRQALRASGLEYRVKVVNRRSPSPIAAGSRSRTGTAGERLDLSYEYIFYVKKSDYEQAAGLLR